MGSLSRDGTWASDEAAHARAVKGPACNRRWCPSIASMATNAALTHIWPIVESSTLSLSGCPPYGRVRFQCDREDIVRGGHSEVTLLVRPKYWNTLFL